MLTLAIQLTGKWKPGLPDCQLQLMSHRLSHSWTELTHSFLLVNLDWTFECCAIFTDDVWYEHITPDTLYISKIQSMTLVLRLLRSMSTWPLGRFKCRFQAFLRYTFPASPRNHAPCHLSSSIRPTCRLTWPWHLFKLSFCHLYNTLDGIFWQLPSLSVSQSGKH